MLWGMWAAFSRLQMKRRNGEGGENENLEDDEN